MTFVFLIETSCPNAPVISTEISYISCKTSADVTTILASSAKSEAEIVICSIPVFHFKASRDKKFPFPFTQNHVNNVNTVSK